MYRNVIGGTALALGLVACGGADQDVATVETVTDSIDLATAPVTEPGQQAHAVLHDAEGVEIGTITLTQEGTSVRLVGDIASLPAGDHGFHFHETGSCEAPTFESAGGHYNPTGASHGSGHPEGPHAGDFPNVTAVDGSPTRVDVTNSMVTLAEGQPNSLFDADGTALIVHADPDDYETQPTGNAGARLACAVVERG